MEIKFADIVQIIVALISFMGLVYSTRQSKKEQKSDKRSQPNKAALKSAPHKTATGPTLLTWASIILLVANFGVMGLRSCSNSTTEVKITEPVAGATVEMREMVKGVSRNIPADHVIWIVIYSQAAGRYYPQNDPADVQANGGWASISSFGIEQDAGIKFDIIAVLVDTEARANFSDYLKQARDKKSWPGVEKLPDSAVKYDRVTVARK